MRWGLATGIEDLSTLTGVPSAAYGLNDTGLVAGEGNGGIAFLRSGTSVEWIGSGKPTPNMAFDVNNSSQVYGSVSAVQGDERGFFWSPATGYADIGTLGGDYTYVYDFNNAGLISGLSEYGNNKYHAMAWSEALGMVDLSPKIYGAATASNDAGQIGGWIKQVVRKVTKYPPVLWTITP
jgi:probable HAF family extracellular repeat protein